MKKFRVINFNENVWLKHGDIKFDTAERRRNYLVSERNYHTTKFFTKHLLGIKMKKKQKKQNKKQKAETLMNKPVYLGLSILEVSKILIYEFLYYYVKSEYGKKTKLCYMNTDSFILYIKTDDIYKDIAENVETRFFTSSY